MNRKTIFIILTIIIFSFILSSCRLDDKETEKGEYKITNINIYKDTPVWELALAVKYQKVKTIEKIIKNQPKLLDYQDPKYGSTLLSWAIGMEKYNSAEVLLKCGADPNIALIAQGETPLFVASGYSWLDNDAKKDPKYVQLLLRYGADTNRNYIGKEIDGIKSIIKPGTSPLMHSISSGIEKTKALVEAGADINYKNENGITAAIQALYGNNPQYAHYLIVEKKAKVSESYYRRKSYGNQDPNEKLYPIDLLRYWVFDLDSKEYKMKMDIVEEFARQGVDYWSTEILDDILQQIKKLYPNIWEEYIKKY